MTSKPFAFLCLMIFIVISAPVWSLPANASEKISLQLKWTHQFQFAGYYAAKEQGYYADAGLDVEFIERTLGIDPIKQVISGKAQYGISDSSIVSEFVKGTQIKALAAIFQHSPLVFISKKSSLITDLFDMKGKRIMLENTDAARAPLDAVLLGAGLREGDYTFVDHTYDNGSLIRDEVDVISNYLTDAPYYIQQQGVDINIINPQDYGVDFYGDILFTSTEEILNHPDRARRFKQATIKGWHYALLHQEELVQLIHDKYNRKLDLDFLHYEAKEIAKLISADTIPLGEIKVSRLLRTSDVYTQLHKTKKLNISDIGSFIQPDKDVHRITLTPQERIWLHEHPLLKFTGTPDWLPYEAFDDKGEYIGIVADHLKLIENNLGIKFNIVASKTWQESVAKVRDGKIDIISETVNSSLTDMMVFTKPYLSSPIIIVMNDKQAYVNNIADISDKKVALIKDYGYIEHITNAYPELDYHWVDTLQQGLEAVSSGKADALLSTLAHASYAISNSAIQNIRIVGKTEFTNKLALGVKKEYAPVLIPLLNRAFDSITEQDKKKIFDKWGKVEFASQTDYRVAIQVSLGLLLLLSIVLYWNRTLRKQIAARKHAEASLKISEYRFSSLLESVDAISVQGYDTERKVIFWNKASEAIYGFTEQEALGKQLEDLIIPSNMRTDLIKAHNDWLKSGIAIPSGELALLRKDGKFVDVFSSHVLQTNVDGKQEMFCIDVDLSERKHIEDKLRQSEARLQEAQRYAQIGYWELLINSKKAIWSEHMYTIFGLPHDSEPGPEILCSVMNQSYHSGFNESLKHSFSTGDEHHIEYPIRRADNGEERWIESRGQKVLGNDGEIEKFSGFIQDITERKRAEESTQAALDKLQKIARLVPGLVYQYRLNLDGKASFPFASDAIKDIYRVKPDDVREDASKVFDILHPDDLDKISTSIQQSAQELTPWQCEYRVKFDDGTINWLFANAMPEHEVDGSTLWHGFITDITERKQAEEKLKLSSRVFTDTHEGITITNAQKEIVDVNPAFRDITGFSRDEVIGKNPSILSSGKQSPEFYAAMWQEINESGHWQGEVWNRKKGGEIYAELLSVSALLDDNGNVINYIGVFTDITHSKQQQEKLSLMAHYDILTGLPNRTLFADRFHQAIAHSNRSEHQLAVCFLDLDNFKPVNDNHGHDAGDQLLIEVAQRITASIREVDTVSRQGGDEFTLLLNDIESYDQCELTLNRILNSLAQPYLIDDTLHNITASIGVTLYPDDNEDIDTLIRHADNAMYQAKQSGKHRYHIFDSMQDQQLTQKHHRLDEIQQALINNEFSLYYQPKVNMVTGKLFGVEALIRWLHPEKGLIPPLDFLPLIDGTDIELQVGDWVIKQALQQMACWLAQDIKLEVSVNIASHHLQSDAFLVNLEAALAQYPSVNSQYLQLEILESSALGDLQAISGIIKTCQEALAVNIALDDFGTGYSSLTHLRNLSANTIKIDQSFVRDMLDDPDDYTIIDGVIGLTDSFNREVIAEGVETTEHGLMLLLMGCEQAQGYGIAKPMPADNLPEWLSTYIPNQDWLSYGNKARTEKETKIRLFRLITEHWKNRFISYIQSSPEDNQYEPIMSEQHDHCGRWINRTHKEGLFEQGSLKRLERAHNNFHFIAQAIHLSYEEGDIDKARGSLEGLITAYNEMSNVVGMCD